MGNNVFGTIEDIIDIMSDRDIENLYEYAGSYEIQKLQSYCEKKYDFKYM